MGLRDPAIDDMTQSGSPDHEVDSCRRDEHSMTERLVGAASRQREMGGASHLGIGAPPKPFLFMPLKMACSKAECKRFAQ